MGELGAVFKPLTCYLKVFYNIRLNNYSALGLLTSIIFALNHCMLASYL